MTTTEAAAKLGVKRRTVQMWCAVLGVAKAGRDYWVGYDDIERIMEHVGKPGRPRKPKPSE